jgi:hypothetical protein
MSELSPYEKLGLTENASFEEIQAAKQRLTQKYKQDVQVIETIEAAYDAIIMDRLKLRQEGKIKVPDQIRFPENLKDQKLNVQPNNFSFTESIKQSPPWLQNLVDTPSVKEVSINGIIFLILIIITVLSSGNQANQTLSLLLTIGVGTNFYLLYQKQRRFWRSSGITLLSLIVGIVGGGFLANVITSSGFTLDLSGDQFRCFVTFCLFWLVSSFLR